jgi:hypothetical protein
VIRAADRGRRSVRALEEARAWLGGLPAPIARRIGWANGAGLSGLPDPLN